MLARDIMNKYVLSCDQDTTMHELIRLFVKHRVSAIPVVGEDNRLEGIVSEGDILYKQASPQVPSYVNVLGASLYYSGVHKYRETFQKLLATRAGDMMTAAVKYVDDDTPADVVTELMIEEHLKNVPVVKDGRLVGMISRWDMLEVIAKEEYHIQPGQIEE